MTAATRSLATALWGARFASGLLPLSYTTRRDTTEDLLRLFASQNSCPAAARAPPAAPETVCVLSGRDSRAGATRAPCVA